MTSPHQRTKGSNKLRQLVAFDHCRVLLPNFTFLRSQNPVSRLHRLAFTDPTAAVRARPLEIRLARFLFAAVALRQSLLFLKRYGSYVTRHYGIATSRQFRDLWYCAWRHNQSPRHYYWRKLFLRTNRESWLAYLEHRQVNTLLEHLNQRLPITRAADKFSFYHHCLAHFLPTPEILAAWSHQGNLLTTHPAPLACDLFAKPTSEYGSVGILIIPYDPVKHTHHFSGRNLAWNDLLAELARHAQGEGQTMILQRRMRNAPRSAVFGNSDLCNLRIVTAHPPGGSPEAIAAFVRLPSSLTTTGHDRHVLIASVDISSGRLGTGVFREITKGKFPVHPDTGAPIAGKILPGWSDMLDLALEAHRTFPWLPFVGWDLIDTEQGVMVLEANAYWGADALQISGAVALGRTRFPEIYLEWFDYLNRTPESETLANVPPVHGQNLESPCFAADRH